MRSYSNTYIFIFSSIMVITVAAILSVAAMTLQPFQKKNVEINKKQNILTSINIESTAKNAEELYDKYILESFAVNSKGEIKEGVDAFSVDMKKELAKPLEERSLPVFVSSLKESKQYIIPVYGKGLWGPIWGFIALETDLNTLKGTSFDHKTETPGLGARITSSEVSQRYNGKKLFDESGNLISISMLKGENNPPSVLDEHHVDGMSGATLTANGMNEMLESYFSYYQPYINKIKKSAGKEMALLN